ncbi:NifB/NifX family molybdenum-iron cluster-binding protein [Magnetospirillum sp. UT-4]|uniref:NifB/NifX family molybdenum-iron cluster-binding protein n=1 Tax=Magnetospirillum sp. UT-4 TaxID=2681467 RepID=UPI001385B9FE|nr:NifB/NifX family molybdenum-iron cluster-binding protein [Magnetospirillum sp. UT-4]CAA7615351.1 Nitrogen fixation-related protein [Magnetospirillum sp. UT-4]
MLIAIASQNWKTVTAHPGKTRRFRLFDAAAGRPPEERPRLELDKEMVLHEYRGDESAHPLFAVDVVIAGSAGEGFIRRLGARGVTVVTTAEPDPLAAIAHFFAGTLPPAAPHHH